MDATPTTAVEPAADLPARSAPPAAGPRLWAAALGGAAVVNAALSLDAVAPVQTKDEIGYLMAARLLGGGGGADLLMPPHAGGYSAGWSLLVAPLWPVLDDPVRFMHATVAANVVLASLAVVVWAGVARRVGAAPRAATAVGAVVAVAPGRALYTGYALPEALLGLLVGLAAWLLLRLWDDHRLAGGAGGTPRTGTACALAVLTAYLSLVHSRFLPTVALLVLVLAWWAWRSRATAGPWVAAAAAAGAVGAVLVNRRVEDLLYGDVDRFAAAGEQVGQLHAGFLTSLVVGHAWYGAVAWGGLAVVGVLWLLPPAVAGLRRRSPGPHAWLLLAAAAQLVVGASYLSTRVTVGAGRLDQLVYGRYADPVWALLAAVGLAALVSGQAGPRLLRTAAVVVAVLGTGVAVVLLALGGIVSGLVQLNVPGVEMWRWEHGGVLRVPWLQATLAALALLLALARAQARGVAAGPVLALVAVLAVAGTAAAEHRTIDERDQRLRDLFSLREVVEEHPQAEVVLVVDRPLLLTGTAFQYWLGDRELRLVDPALTAVQVRPGDLVVATLDPRPRFIGAPRSLVKVDPTYRYGVWLADAGPTWPGAP